MGKDIKKLENFEEKQKIELAKNIPDNWKQCKIGDIANIYVGRDLQESAYSKTKTDTHIYPVYSNAVDNYGLYGYYNFEEYPGGCLTVVGRGYLGVAFPRDEGFGAIGRLLVISPKNNAFNARYLAEYINTRLKIFNESSGVPQLTGASFAKYKVILPTYEEQVFIAETLKTWDTAIEKTDALINAKEKQFEWLIHTLISQNQGSDKWKEIAIGDLFTILTHSSKSSSICAGGKYYIVDMGSISRKGDLIVSKKSNCCEDMLDAGELVMPKDDIGGGNIIGKVAIIDIGHKYICGDHVYRLNNNAKQTVLSHFAKYTINSPPINKIFRAKANGTSQLGLNKKDIVKQPIRIPNISVQQNIVETLNTAQQEINLLKKLAEQYRTQKRGLMQKLLTGEWRLKST